MQISSTTVPCRVLQLTYEGEAALEGIVVGEDESDDDRVADQHHGGDQQ